MVIREKKLSIPIKLVNRNMFACLKFTLNKVSIAIFIDCKLRKLIYTPFGTHHSLLALLLVDERSGFISLHSLAAFECCRIQCGAAAAAGER